MIENSSVNWGVKLCRVGGWFNEDEEFTKDVVKHDDDDLADDFDEFIVKVEKGNEDEHNTHVDEESK